MKNIYLVRRMLNRMPIQNFAFSSLLQAKKCQKILSGLFTASDDFEIEIVEMTVFDTVEQVLGEDE